MEVKKSGLALITTLRLLQRHLIKIVSAVLIPVIFPYLILGPKLLYALPQDWTVESGDVSFNVSEDNSMLTINASNNAIINFGSFNIGQGEMVQFIQPGMDSSVLSRVTGGGSSDIFGSLFSNGQLVLINQNGITFHDTANVQVGSLIASTLDIQSSLYLSNQFTFEKLNNSNPASIFNEGTITARDGGSIALLSDQQILNSGSITANLGSIALGVGEKQTISFDNNGLINLIIESPITTSGVGLGITNASTGLLQANGGRINLSVKTLNDVLDTLINNEGIIEATQAVERDGRVEFISNGAVVNAGTLNANDIYEQGYTFRSTGAVMGGKIYHDNLDGAAFYSGDVGSNITDAGNIEFSNNIRLTANNLIFEATNGLIDMHGFQLNGNGGNNVTFSASNLGGNNQLGSFTDVGTLTLTKSSFGFMPTYALTQDLTSGVANLTVSGAGNNVTLNTSGYDFSISGNFTNSGIITQAAGSSISIGGNYSQTAGSFTAANAASDTFSAGGSFSVSSGTFNRFTGAGTSGNPYTIYDVYGLQAMSRNLSASYALANDINAAGTSLWGSGFTAGFLPVGDNTTPFTGTFNGSNHVISDLYINRPFTNYVGLIGYASGASSQTISNVGLVNANVSAQSNSAILVGDNQGFTISNTFTTGIFSGTGGVTGAQGGLVGNNVGTIQNSYSTASVGGGFNGGGGGLVGNNSGTITNSYSTGNVTNLGGAGGLVGINSGTINTSFTTSVVSNGSGGLVGTNNAGSYSNNYWDSDVNPGHTDTDDDGDIANITSLTSAQMKQAANFTGFNFSGTWTMAEDIAGPYLDWQSVVYGHANTDLGFGIFGLGAGVSVSVLVNGASAASDVTTDANSAYFFRLNKFLQSGDKVLVFMNSDMMSFEGSTVAVAAGSSVTGLDMYQNSVIVRSETGSVITNATLSAAKGSANDADILYSVSGSDLTLTAGYDLIVWTGNTFTPGGNVTTRMLGIQSGATANAGSNTINVSGNFTNQGTFNAGTSTVNFNGTGVSEIRGTGNSFYNFTVSGSGGQTETYNDFSITHDYVQTDGTFSDGSHDISLTGDFTKTGGTYNGGGTFTFNKTSGTQTITSGGATFRNVVFNDTNGATGGKTTFLLEDTLTTSYDMTLTSGILDVNAAENNSLVIGNSWFVSDTFLARQGTVQLGGGNSFADREMKTNSQAFNNLSLAAAFGASNFVVDGSFGDLDVNGDLSVTNAVLVLTTNNPNMTTAGNVTFGNSGSLTRGSGSWTMDGTGTSTLTYNTADFATFGDVTIDGDSKTVQLSTDQAAVPFDNLVVGIDDTLDANGALYTFTSYTKLTAPSAAPTGPSLDLGIQDSQNQPALVEPQPAQRSIESSLSTSPVLSTNSEPAQTSSIQSTELSENESLIDSSEDKKKDEEKKDLNPESKTSEESSTEKAAEGSVQGSVATVNLSLPNLQESVSPNGALNNTAPIVAKSTLEVEEGAVDFNGRMVYDGEKAQSRALLDENKKPLSSQTSLNMRGVYVLTKDGLNVKRAKVNDSIQDISIKEAPADLVAAKKSDKVYLFSQNGKVSSIDTNTFNTKSKTVFSEGSSNAVLSPDEQKAYVTNSLTDSVEVLDLATSKTQNFPTHGSMPLKAAMTQSGDTLFISNTLDGTVSKMDTKSGNIMNTFKAGDQPLGLHLSRDEKTLYVTDYSKGVLKALDTQSGDLLKEIKVGDGPYAIEIDPKESTLLVSNRNDNTISVINLKNFEERARIQVGTRPMGITITPEGNKAYVTNQLSSNVSLIDLNKDSVLQTIPTGTAPSDVLISGHKSGELRS